MTDKRNRTNENIKCGENEGVNEVNGKLSDDDLNDVTGGGALWNWRNLDDQKNGK